MEYKQRIIIYVACLYTQKMVSSMYLKNGYINIQHQSQEN